MGNSRNSIAAMRQQLAHGKVAFGPTTQRTRPGPPIGGCCHASDPRGLDVETAGRVRRPALISSWLRLGIGRPMDPTAAGNRDTRIDQRRRDASVDERLADRNE